MSSSEEKNILQRFLDDLEDDESKILIESYVKTNDPNQLEKGFNTLLTKLTSNQEEVKNAPEEHNN